RVLADAQAEAIRKVNDAIRGGGQASLVLRQLEMLPQIVPAITDALAQSKMVTLSADGNGAPGQTTSHITDVIQTVLAAQLVNGALNVNGNGNGAVDPDLRRKLDLPAEARPVVSPPTRETTRRTL